jgi:hypothetical protein
MGVASGKKRHQAKKIVAMLCLLYAAGCYAEQISDQPMTDNLVAPQETQTIPDGIQTASLTPILPPVAIAAPTRETIPTTPVLLPSEEATSSNPQNKAIAAAVADGVTTGMALSAGAIETNAFINATPIGATPIGLIALTGMKIGLVKYAETLPQEEKRTVMKTSSALWGGAAINNLMVLMAAPPPFPILAGLLMGFVVWNNMDGEYQQEDAVMAARATKERESANVMAPQSVVVKTADISGN